MHNVVRKYRPAKEAEKYESFDQPLKKELVKKRRIEVDSVFQFIELDHGGQISMNNQMHESI